MKWYANELGYAEDEEYWGIAGLLHDIDFELYPEEHCLKAPELLREAGISEEIDAFMTLAFVSLPVIPKLRLNTYGVVDVEQQKIVPAVF